MRKEIKIIPAINEVSFEEIKNKINLISGFFDFAHLDIADGSFTPNILWSEPEKLKSIKTDIKIEAHLMVLNPEYVFEKWMQKNIVRIIFNLETVNNFNFLSDKCRARGIEVGLSITPNTSFIVLKPYLYKIDLVQILAVSPGNSGQKFDGISLEKISALRAMSPSCLIEVDGGINLKTAKSAVSAGADILVSSSYVFGGDFLKIKNRIENLKNVLD